MSHPDGDAPKMAPVLRYGVAAVVRRDNRFLVVRRAQGIVAPGLFCFPGGGIEPAETEEAAVVREFQEELGAAVRPIRRVWRCQSKWQVDLAWWYCELDDATQLLANPLEVESIHWLASEELTCRTDLLDSNHEFLRQVAAGRVRLGR